MIRFLKSIWALGSRVGDHRRSANHIWPVFFWKCAAYHLQGKAIFAHKKARIRGVKNISTNGELKIGLQDVGFKDREDATYLHVRGKLVFRGDFSIGKGCRIDIGPDASVLLGKQGYITADTLIVIMHSLSIGDNCAISWNCQFRDDDFHQVDYPGRTPQTANGIEIGNHVWIGCNTSVYKGSKIPDGCVIAANSVVKGVFEEKNVLIAGNPARIIKRDVKWN